MPAHRTRRRESVPYSPFPLSANAIRYARETSACQSTRSSVSQDDRMRWADRFDGDRCLPSGSEFWQLLRECPRELERERVDYMVRRERQDWQQLRERERVSTSVSLASRARSGSDSSTSSSRLRSTSSDIEDYLDLLYLNVGEQRLSSVLSCPEVVFDRHRRRFHSGPESARQYDLTQRYV